MKMATKISLISMFMLLIYLQQINEPPRSQNSEEPRESLQLVSTVALVSSPLFTVYVRSAVREFSLRQLLRDTWVGQVKRQGLPVHFVVAASLYAEEMHALHREQRQHAVSATVHMQT
jgi:hypothetical protein